MNQEVSSTSSITAEKYLTIEIWEFCQVFQCRLNVCIVIS